MRTIWGHSHICGIGGDFQPDPTKLYGVRTTVVHYNKYGDVPFAPPIGECDITTTETQSTTSYDEPSGTGCPDVVIEDDAGCSGLPQCGGEPFVDCITVIGSDTPDYSAEVPAAPSPAMNTDDWSAWSAGSGIPQDDFRGSGAPALSTGSQPALNANRGSYYSEFILDHVELEIRRLAGALRVPIKLVITCLEYLWNPTTEAYDAPTSATVTLMIPADGSSVNWEVPHPSANGYVIVSEMDYYIPGRA